jgi:hypothetical protein
MQKGWVFFTHAQALILLLLLLLTQSVVVFFSGFVPAAPSARLWLTRSCKCLAPQTSPRSSALRLDTQNSRHCVRWQDVYAARAILTPFKRIVNLVLTFFALFVRRWYCPGTLIKFELAAR